MDEVIHVFDETIFHGFEETAYSSILTFSPFNKQNTLMWT